MKRYVFIILSVFFFIIFIGFISSNKKTEINLKFDNFSDKLVQNQKKQKEILNETVKDDNFKNQLPTSSDLLSFNLEFQRELNKSLNDLINKVKINENKSISEYTNEIKKLKSEIEHISQQGSLSSNDFEKISQALAEIKPPPLVYNLHLEILKTYYTVAFTLKKAQETDDINKKILLYNLIKSTLENFKL